MMEKKFLNYIHRFNLHILNNEVENYNHSFVDYFKKIIDNSHLFIKTGYKLFMFSFFIFFLINKLFFISKKNEYRLFEYLINIFSKTIILKEILKFIKIHSIIFNYD